MHRRRYSAVDAGDGRGGKLDLGSRSVDDHDARRSRVGATIVASWADWTPGTSVVGDIFLELRGASVRLARMGCGLAMDGTRTTLTSVNAGLKPQFREFV